MEKLTPFAKVLIAVIAAGSSWAAVHTYAGEAEPVGVEAEIASRQQALAPAAGDPSAGAESAKQGGPGALPELPADLDRRPIRVALSQWPGHMALVVGVGGLRTQAGSPAALEGLDVEIRFIEDAASKNEALAKGEVDFVWQTVDEMPISLGAFASSRLDVRAFLQIDWSRGGDACVASSAIREVEDIHGRRSAMLMFSPDHTVFEFMISNSRLTPKQASEVRAATHFSLDDFTYGRKLFVRGEVDVACLWEPDVSLALSERKGAHRLFSTADATELVADVLLARKDLLDARSDIAQKLARVWFGGVKKAEADRRAAARLIAQTCSRFRDELGEERTLGALSWAKWTTLADNVRFFGLDGTPPAFDRVYNQADSIWINYPQAEIEHRFPPGVLRDDRVTRALWEQAGKPAAAPADVYDPTVAFRGEALFTKPVSVNFATASALLGPASIAVINREIVPQLEIARGMSIRVEGNTDSTGDAWVNQALSQRRAQAIVDYLVSRGVPKNRVVARGNGASKPVAANDTPQGRAQNRRTDILFIRAGG